MSTVFAIPLTGIKQETGNHGMDIDIPLIINSRCLPWGIWSSYPSTLVSVHDMYYVSAHRYFYFMLIVNYYLILYEIQMSSFSP